MQQCKNKSFAYSSYRCCQFPILRVDGLMPIPKVTVVRHRRGSASCVFVRVCLGYWGDMSVSIGVLLLLICYIQGVGRFYMIGPLDGTQTIMGPPGAEGVFGVLTAWSGRYISGCDIRRLRQGVVLSPFGFTSRWSCERSRVYVAQQRHPTLVHTIFPGSVSGRCLPRSKMMRILLHDLSSMHQVHPPPFTYSTVV